MSIVSFGFWGFVALVTVLYFVIPKKFQWVAILAANVIFYLCAGLRYIEFILIATIVTFFVAIKIEDLGKQSSALVKEAGADKDLKKKIKARFTKKRKAICTLAVLIVVGIWIVLKYTNFFLSNFNAIASLINPGCSVSYVSWVLPLGISYYTFHAIGYVVDVYRNKYPAEHNFAKFFTFISYFPHIIQGPFSRFDTLGKSIFEGHSFSYDRLCIGARRVLWGLFKKLLIADKLGVAVNAIFAGYSDYSGWYIIFYMLAYCVQLYADFSGYMDIVCGISKIWGIDLDENFKRPYFAKTIDEFWRRWHITLGTWFRDYVFYPVSIGKVGQKFGKSARKKWGPKTGKLVPGYFALIFVWTATGLWHGANWTYLVWGYLNLLVIMLTMQLTDFYTNVKSKLHINSDSLGWKIFCIVRTFILVCFFRFFSNGENLRQVFSILKHMVCNLQISTIGNFESFFVGMGKIDICVVLIGTVLLFFVDLFGETGKWEIIKDKCPAIVRDIVYAALVVMLIMFAGGSSDLTGGFMYANF